MDFVCQADSDDLLVAEPGADAELVAEPAAAELVVETLGLVEQLSAGFHEAFAVAVEESVGIRSMVQFKA